MSRFVATVLYEDKAQIGGDGFPPHDFVLAMVGDLVGRDIWDLRKIVDKNPRNGISKLLLDAKRTSLLAGRGVLCMLVDRDRIAEHVGLPKTTTDDVITAQIREKSDAPEKLFVYYLDPNMEGLMQSIERCAPHLPAPGNKDHNARDIYLKKAAFSVPASVRACVKNHQPSLAKLVQQLTTLCQSPNTPI